MAQERGGRAPDALAVADPHRVEAIGHLASPSVHSRAEGARLLAAHGTVGDLPLLMRLAREDRSPAVRLGVVTAAAAILVRERRLGRFGEREAAEVLDGLKGVDPGVNPGLFAVLGALGTPAALRRIRVGLRDPRYDVRQGAGVGLLRWCSRLDALGRSEVVDEVLGWWEDAGLAPDARASLLTVASCCGWQDARPLARAALDEPGQLAQAAREAIDRLDHLADPAALLGPWSGQGLEVGEQVPGLPETWWVLGEDFAIRGREGEALEALPARVAGDRLQFGEVAHPYHRLWLRGPGASERADVLVFGGGAWYRADADSVLRIVDALYLGPPPAGRERAAGLLAPLLVRRRNTDRRARAILDLLAGQPRQALDRVEQLLRARHPPPDLHLLAGDALAALGRHEEARAAWRACTEAGPPASPWVELAASRLAGDGTGSEGGGDGGG